MLLSEPGQVPLGRFLGRKSLPNHCLKSKSRPLLLPGRLALHSRLALANCVPPSVSFSVGGGPWLSHGFWWMTSRLTPPKGGGGVPVEIWLRLWLRLRRILARRACVLILRALRGWCLLPACRLCHGGLREVKATISCRDVNCPRRCSKWWCWRKWRFGQRAPVVALHVEALDFSQLSVQLEVTKVLYKLGDREGQGVQSV